MPSRKDQRAESLAVLKNQLANVINDYQAWGVKRTISEYARVTELEEEDLVAGTDWENETPALIVREQFLRSGDRFRSECFEPRVLQRVFAYDGSIGRIRDVHRVQNAPVPGMLTAFEDSFAPKLPHTMLVDYFFAPDLAWIFGTRNTPSLVDEDRPKTTFQIEQVVTLGHPCWKLTWRAMTEENGNLMTRCEAHLAQDRSLLPISQSYFTPVSVHTVERRDIVATDFFKDEKTGLWFPSRITASTRFGDKLDVSRVKFESTDAFEKSVLFTKTGTVAASHANPPKPLVRSYSPFPILTTLPAPTLVELDQSRQYRIRLALLGMLAVVGIGLLIAATLQFTRLGKLSRESFRRHPLMLGATGLVLTLVVGLCASWLPGWKTFGLAMMLAGLFGFAWIAFSMLLIGDKTISIRVALAAAACMALFFGGYQQGIKRMQVRQKMIRDVRDGGGQVVMGQWRLDEAGLFLPQKMRLLLGEAWSGRANRAAIEHAAFTETNVRRWCLDEVRWLGVGSQLGEYYAIPQNALAQLKGSETLWTLHFEGGHLDGPALRELKRFPKLIDLHFNCHRRPVSPELLGLASVERLCLTDAVLNDQLVDLLAKMPSLETVSLIRPVFKQITADHENLDLENINIQFSTVTPKAMNALGQLPTQLLFSDCNFRLPPNSDVIMPSTQSMVIRDSRLDNQSLMSLTHSPRLTHMELADTAVSEEGIESFTGQRPTVAMSLQLQ